MAKFLNLLKLRGFTSPSDAAVEISAATDSASASRLRIDAGGKLTWGDGTNAGDTNLYRTIANTLKTDDYLVAEGGMTIESYQVTTVGASAGNALVFDGTKFAPGAVSGGGAAGSTYVATIGNGASTTFTVTHGLNTRDVVVVVRNANSPYEVIDVQWEATSTSTVTFNFGTPPASNSVRVGIYSATTGDNVVLSLDNLTDVVITAPEEFQGLSYNGTEWVNSHIPLVSYVRNAEATTITTGTCVYLFGSTGDHATVKRASNTSDATSSKTIGVAGANIAASQNGPIITRGYVDGIDLSTGYTAGDVLWLGTNGQFTKTKPTAPDHLVFIGVVVRATNNGIIYVATQNGYELDEIHNVSLPNPQPGEFLKYNGSLWVADAIDLGTDTTGNYVQQISAGTGVTVTGSPSEAGIPIVSIGQAIGTSDSPTFDGITIGNLANTAMYYSSMNSGRVSFGTTTASASAQVTIKSSNMSYAPLVLQSAISQSANLQEWQDPTNLPLAFVNSAGSFTTYAGVAGASVSATTINKGATLASDTDLTLRYTASGSPTQDANINVNRGTSPAVGIRWNETTDKWQFTNDGTTYKDLGSGGITVSDTAPSTPATGDLWYESDTGATFVYYDSYWIEVGGAGALADGSVTAAKLATDSVVTAKIQDGAVTTDKIAAGAVATVDIANNAVTQAKLSTDVPLSGMRNKIINGGFDIWQRGLDLTTLGSDAYNGPDRWRTRTAAVGGSLRLTRQSSGLAGTVYCARVQRTASNSSTGSLQIVQTLESSNSIPMAGQPVTFSFWARKGADYSPSSSLMSAAVVSGTGTDQYWLSFTGGVAVIDTTVTLTTSWQRFTFTATPAANASQFYIKFEMNPTGTAGTNDYFEVTGVQFESGSQATPFEQRLIDVEIQLCQRYFSKSFQLSTAPVNGNGTGDNSGNNLVVWAPTVSNSYSAAIHFPVRMRRTPDVTLYNAETTTANTWSVYNSTGQINNAYSVIIGTRNERSMVIYAAGITTITVSNGAWAASAEL